jgi:hypothetical protein
MYLVGEEMFARADYAGAERMLAHAIVQLPPTSHNDHLRHALVMRLAHIEMVYADRSGDPGPVRRANEMLESYLAKHRALFGEQSTPERDEIYEQLGQVALVQEQVVQRRRRAQAPEPEPAAVARATEAEGPTESVDAHEGDALEADEGWSRKLRVRRNRYGDHTDAEIRERLRSQFYDAEVGLWLTRGHLVKYSEARALVRLQPPVETQTASDEAFAPRRRQAWAWARRIVAAVRPALEQCYSEAFSRVPINVQQVEVTFELGADGGVHAPRIAGGGLGDGRGDACVVASLREASLDRDNEPPETTVAMRVPLLFMFEAERYVDEWTGEAASHGRFGFGWREFNPDIVPQRDSKSIDAPANLR